MISEILFYNYLRITTVVCFYWIVSILTVFVNKTLLSDKSIDLDAPFFILWYQCFITVLICLSIKFLSKSFPRLFSFPNGSPFDPTNIKAVAPLSVLFTSMIVFNSLCLKYVMVSFYYLGRSLTTVFNVVLTYLVLKETVSFKACLCCLLIAAGFFLGIDQETSGGTLSLSGTVFGLMSSLSLALYSIHTSKVLPLINKNVWLLSYYVNVYACIILAPLILLSGESSIVLNYKHLYTSNFWTLMTISGVCGFAIGYATSLQIKVTSPLTHNISGTAKSCAQTVIATYWYSERRSWLWWFSNWIVLMSSGAYTSVKQSEMRKKLEQSRTIV